MRVATALTAIAALWVQPAEAVTITLTGANSTDIQHQKVALTGLTGADTISVSAFFGSFSMYNWGFYDGQWHLDGNDYVIGDCVVSGGSCHEEYARTATAYPSYNIGMSSLADISVIGNDIFVDWSKFSTGYTCGLIPEAERVDGNANKCSFQWKDSNLLLTVNVNGPSAKTFGYSVSNVVPSSPVPEPASWALMIAGIGMAGASMRRRQRQKVTYILARYFEGV